MKRIGVLTLALHSNYGGILQAAALSQHLMAQGHEVVLLNKMADWGLAKRAALAMLKAVPGQNLAGVRGRELNRALHRPFIRSLIPKVTAALRTREDLARAVSDLALDAVVVGSDQVWRGEYHPGDQFEDYFLGFVRDPQVRRIAYAASFGHGSWMYPERTVAVSKDLARFQAVLVREDSGALICRSDLGRADAEVVVDPTMLLAPERYRAMAAAKSDQGAGQVATGAVVSYILDKRPLPRQVAAWAASCLGGDVAPLDATDRLDGRPQDVPGWLQALDGARFIVTDSFHGTVFAILFQRPFICLVNASRGADRFITLLSRLGLEDRMLSTASEHEVRRLAETPVDFERAMEKLSLWRDRSASLLERAVLA